MTTFKETLATYGEEIRNGYVSGKSIGELAAQYKIGKTTVYKVLESYNVVRRQRGKRKQKKSEELLDRIASAYRDTNLTLQEIARKFNVGNSTVERAVVSRIGADYKQQFNQPRGVTARKHNKIIEMFNAGAELEDIAHDIGNSVVLVSKVLRDNGFSVRKCVNCGGSIDNKRQLYCSDTCQRLTKEYNISKEEYDATYKTQKGRCAICGDEGTLVIDHDHRTGEFRGLLCGTCNSGIGMLKDDPTILRRAIQYLKA